MSYTYDTENATSYTNDTSTSEHIWDDADLNWDSAFSNWGGNTPYTYDTELSTSYTNDTI